MNPLCQCGHQYEAHLHGHHGDSECRTNGCSCSNFTNPDISVDESSIDALLAQRQLLRARVRELEQALERVAILSRERPAIGYKSGEHWFALDEVRIIATAALHTDKAAHK